MFVMGIEAQSSYQRCFNKTDIKCQNWYFIIIILMILLFLEQILCFAIQHWKGKQKKRFNL